MTRKNEIDGSIINRKKLQKRIIIFGFFLCISSFFWFLNALSKQYTSNISVPIKYVNAPQGKAHINEMPSHINLRVNAYGFTLIKHHLFNKDIPVYFDIEKNIGKNSGNNVLFFTNHHKESFESDQISEFEINQIFPDSLLFVFEKAFQKKVQVISDIEITLKKQYQLKDMVSFSPDSILISGPSYILDSIDFVLTENIKIENLSNDISIETTLKPLKGITFDHDNVTAAITVEKYTERVLSIPIKFINLPEKTTIIPSEDKITIQFNVGLSKYNDFSEDNFEAIVECGSINNKQEKLKIQLSHPFDIKIESYFPQEIDYIFKQE